MPIYEYVCTSCDHRADILHGINDPTPQFCPSCGREGTMRKLFAPPTIHFKGSGWAKKDRATTRSTRAANASESKTSESGGDGGASKGATTDGGKSDGGTGSAEKGSGSKADTSRSDASGSRASDPGSSKSSSSSSDGR